MDVGYGLRAKMESNARGKEVHYAYGLGSPLTPGSEDDGSQECLQLG